MTDKKINIKDIFANGHLTDEGIALWAEALINKNENDLPEKLKEHVDRCLDCKKQILELYSDLKEIEKQDLLPDSTEENTKIAHINRKVIYSIAAVIIILISAAALIYFSKDSKIDNQQLFAEYYKPYPNVITVKGMNDKLMGAGMYYYDVAKYDSALLFYNKILEGNPQKPEVLFYKGISLLALGKPDETIKVLNTIAHNNKSPYKNQAKWYLALSYLKKGNIKKAKEILRAIIKENTFYSKNARELLNKI